MTVDVRTPESQTRTLSLGSPDRQLLVASLAAAGAGAGGISVAAANALGRAGEPGVSACYWIGLGLLYAAPTAGAYCCRRSRSLVLVLTGVLVAGLYLVYLSATPSQFGTTDEFQTLRSLLDLQRTHHLFGANPLVSDYSKFPGSQVVFVVLHQLTGLSLATSARSVIFGELLAQGFALFTVGEILLGSPLVAYLGVAIYATNASYLYFDAQVFYESFALPLAIVSVALVLHAVRTRSQLDRYIILVLAAALGVAVGLSHHMVSYWLAAVLVLWSVVAAVHNYRHRRDDSAKVICPWIPAAATTLFAGGWYLFVAHQALAHELGPVFNSAYSAVKSVISGASGPKAPFSTPASIAAVNDPPFLKILGYLSAFGELVLLVLGLWQLRHRRWRAQTIAVFAFVALLYPLGLALRLTEATTETSSRTNEYSFVGLAVVAGLLWIDSLDPSLRRHASFRSRVTTGLVAIGGITLLGLGSVVVGQAPYDRIAGPYLVGADIRSVDPLGEQAAAWTAAVWPAGTRFAADPTNSRLIAALGEFVPEDGQVDGLSVGQLFLSPTVDSADLRILAGDKIDYVVIDQRLTEAPSATGPVFGSSMPGVRVTASAPVPAISFAKFAASPDFSLVYDNGTIRIFKVNSSLISS